MNATVERLQSHYDFPQHTVEVIGEVMDRVQNLTYDQFLLEANVPEPIRFHEDGMFDSTDILDFYDENRHDPAHARVLYLPMGSGPTPNKVVRAGVLHLADPDTRLIVAGNPGIPFRDSGGRLNPWERQDVAREHRLRPLVDPVLRYMNGQGIATSEHAGQSLGATKAMAAGEYADKYDLEVVQVTSIEAVNVAARGLVGITKAFGSTNAGYRELIKEIDFPLLKESRKLSENGLTYFMALLRLSNIATARALGTDTFERDAAAYLQKQPCGRLSVVWGDKSEMALDGPTEIRVARLQYVFERERVRGMRMRNAVHTTTGDDVALHAANVLTASQAA